MEALDEAWKGSLRRPLLLLTIAALLLLAIVCTNVVNLILARSLARAREMESHRLGAGLTDIVRQLLAEALALCAAGGALGLLLAGAFCAASDRAPPASRRPLYRRRALVFASAVCPLVALLCGLALRSPRAAIAIRSACDKALWSARSRSVSCSSLARAHSRVFLKLANRNPDSTVRT